MNTKTFNQLFNAGCFAMAAIPKEWGEAAQAAGFNQNEWETLVQEEYWSANQAQSIGDKITLATSLSLAIANLPPIPLSVTYVAAVICTLVAPCNRITAGYKGPLGFDPMSALGIMHESVTKTASREQLLALIEYFSNEDFANILLQKVDPVAEATVTAMQENDADV